MEDSELEKYLNELMSTINPDYAPGAKEPSKPGSTTNIAELRDYLRVCIKYQVFDLEATRREASYLRKVLEDSSREEG